jgi:hypothetical protein
MVELEDRTGTLADLGEVVPNRRSVRAWLLEERATPAQRKDRQFRRIDYATLQRLEARA